MPVQFMQRLEVYLSSGHTLGILIYNEEAEDLIKKLANSTTSRFIIEGHWKIEGTEDGNNWCKWIPKLIAFRYNQLAGFSLTPNDQVVVDQKALET